MQGQGFKEVYNLAGGIKAWDGLAATGPESWGLELTLPGDGPGPVLASAYSLEAGLALCYQRLQARTANQDVAALFAKLAGIEQEHQRRLSELFHELTPNERGDVSLQAEAQPVIMEGGYGVDEFIVRQAGSLDNPAQVVMLALTLETQALDLYLRLAQQAQLERTRQALLTIANEEQAHLKALGNLLDSLQT